MKYGNILAAICDDVWAIQPEKMDAILGVIRARQQGIVLDAEEFRAASERRAAAWGVKGSVAVMGVVGTISHRPSAFSSGGVSMQELAAQFNRYVSDDSVGAIVLDIDSPGGSAMGLPEFVDQIYAARGKKPIEAVANTVAASAAYWIGSAADRLSVTPSGMVGSVGTIVVHTDTSKMEEQEGIAYEYITSSKYKAESHLSSLTDEARGHLQQVVDAYGQQFVSGLARNFGVSKDHVAEHFGQGRMVMAKDAVARGMAHAVATLDEVVARLQRPRGRSAAAAKVAMHRQRLRI